MNTTTRIVLITPLSADECSSRLTIQLRRKRPFDTYIVPREMFGSVDDHDFEIRTRPWMSRYERFVHWEGEIIPDGSGCTLVITHDAWLDLVWPPLVLGPMGLILLVMTGLFVLFLFFVLLIVLSTLLHFKLIHSDAQHIREIMAAVLDAH